MFLNFPSRAVVWQWSMYILSICSSDKHHLIEQQATITNIAAHPLTGLWVTDAMQVKTERVEYQVLWGTEGKKQCLFVSS